MVVQCLLADLLPCPLHLSAAASVVAMSESHFDLLLCSVLLLHIKVQK